MTDVKNNKWRLAVMETKMLRSTNAVTSLDHIRNEDIPDRYGVASIVKKLREKRLRRCGHVSGANDNSLPVISLNIEVDGKRPKGRPGQRCLDTDLLDLKAFRLRPNQAFHRTKKDETDHDEPTPPVNGRKAKEKERYCRENFNNKGSFSFWKKGSI